VLAQALANDAIPGSRPASRCLRRPLVRRQTQKRRPFGRLFAI
jgi:hypothetical protein